jgi:hypothetical protein
MYEHRLSLSESEGVLVSQALLPRTETAVAYTILDTRRAKSGGVYTECMNGMGMHTLSGQACVWTCLSYQKAFQLSFDIHGCVNGHATQVSARWASSPSTEPPAEKLGWGLLRQGFEMRSNAWLEYAE